MKTCPFPREITEKGAQSLRLKMRSAELHSKEATDVTPCSRLQQDCLNYRQKLERLECSHLLHSGDGTCFQLFTRRVSDDTKLLRFSSLR